MLFRQERLEESPNLALAQRRARIEPVTLFEEDELWSLEWFFVEEKQPIRQYSADFFQDGLRSRKVVEKLVAEHEWKRFIPEWKIVYVTANTIGQYRPVEFPGKVLCRP